MAEIISTVVSKIVDWLASCAKQQLSYLCDYKTNFGKLKTEVQKLMDERSSIQQKVDEAQRNRETSNDNVISWLKRASEIIDEADKLIRDEETANKRCCYGCCPNSMIRYQLSEKAATFVIDIVALWQEASRFQNNVSHRTVPEDIRITSTKDYETFESRVSILKDIIGALINPNFNMIGVYGMGGIGKTTLVKEVARQAERDNLFDRIVFAEVSQRPDIKKIQGEIADKLGLKFDEESETGRADSLCDRLKKEKKILVILDDIWASLKLDIVGIPSGDDHMGCKVLLTTRSKNVLSKMDSQKDFPVDQLNKVEAWSLFKKKAGDYIEDPEYKSVATKVAEECAGLPVAIVTVASALRRKKPIEYWEDFLEKLKTPSSKNFENIHPDAYKAIKLSYDKLENEELQKIFLLIAYTYITSFDELLMYGMGLDLFQGTNMMEKAHRRVRASVLELKDSCMLLEGEWDEDFSIHDVVRDVAISIASTEHHVFTARNKQVDSPELQDKDYTSIVLHDVKKSRKLLKVLKCPQLKLFSVRANDSSFKIPENCFAGMVELKVLHFAQRSLSPLPSSLRLLTNLQTLYLHSCKLKDMAVIRDLKKLKILWFRECYVKQLPSEVGQLTQLKSLDLRSCDDLEVIPPNVIRSLSHLEELYIGDSFTEWEVDDLINTERRNASLDDLKHLRKLTCLEIQVKDANSLPRDLSFEKLKRYKISIGEDWWSRADESPEISRKFNLELINTNICLNMGHIMQLKEIQDLSLEGLQDMKNVLYGLDKAGFKQLKHLQIRKNPNLPFLIDSMEHLNLDAFPLLESLHLGDLNNLEKICHGQFPAQSFGKLKTIEVEECNKLKTIFPLFIARRLSQLQEIEVSNCENMEAIFDMGGEEEPNNNSEVIDSIELSQLRSLELNSLPQLTSFCSKLKSHQRWEESTAATTSNEIILEEDIDVSNEKLHFGFHAFIFSSLERLEIIRCPKFNYTFVNEKVFPNLEELKIDENGLSAVVQFSEDLLCKLKRLEVQLDVLSVISSLDLLIHRLHNMKVFQKYGIGLLLNRYISAVVITEVEKSSKLKHILQEFNMDNWVDLEVCGCPDLINLVPSSTSFQNLTTLTIWNCRGLKYIVTSITAKSLVRLRNMSISHCGMITKIVVDDEEEATKDDIVFSELKELSISYLFNLTSFYSGNCTLKFPSLDLVIVNDVPKMKIFCEGELSTPKLHKIKKDEFKNGECWNWKGDLNSTIQHLYYEGKENLKLENIEVERIWQDQADVESFGVHNLKQLIIKSGWNLRYIITSSMVKSFVRLEHLEISHCYLLEDIVIDDDLEVLREEERKDAVSFPSLKHLEITHCPKFNFTFVNEKSFPSLKHLVTTKCPKFNSTFVNEKVFTNLERLKINSNGIATVLQFADLDFLCKLKGLYVEFDNSTVTLSLDFLISRFHKKKILKIFGYNSGWSLERYESEEFVMISYINLSSELKHILQQESNMDNWVDVDIRECKHLINLVPSSTSFQNLTTLTVVSCRRLTNIVTSSTAKSLVQLKKIHIDECEMITEIVTNDKGDAAIDEIVLSELKELVITRLENLTSFYSGNCTLKFPSLELVTVNDCPEMKSFYGGELSTPKLCKVKKDDSRDKEWWKGDLNSTIQHLQEEKESEDDEQ